MSKRRKLTGDNYLDSTSIVHNKKKLSTILDILLGRYSEGTFVPRLEGANEIGQGQYTLQLGFYRKIGRIVFYQFQIGCKSLINASGYLLIQGFPCQVSCAPNLGQLIAAGELFNSEKTWHTRTYDSGLLIEPNSSMDAINNAVITTQHYIYGSGFYFTNE